VSDDIMNRSEDVLRVAGEGFPPLAAMFACAIALGRIAGEYGLELDKSLELARAAASEQGAQAWADGVRKAETE
jgi:hypothetical protein